MKGREGVRVDLMGQVFLCVCEGNDGRRWTGRKLLGVV